MRCYLLRHGEAESVADSDRVRALTRRGRADNQAVANSWHSRGDKPGVVLSSPLLRAVQTAEQVANRMSVSSVTETELLTPDADLATLLALLEQYIDRQPLLVGHNPLLSRVLAELVGDDPDSHPYMDTSQLVCLEMDVVAPSCAVLKYSLNPDTR